MSPGALRGYGHEEGLHGPGDGLALVLAYAIGNEFPHQCPDTMGQFQPWLCGRTGAWANTADWSGDGSISTGMINLWGDPAFVGPGDYHLTQGSTAIDAGVDAGTNADVDLDLRPIGAGFDIGADEFPPPGETATPEISTTLV